MLDGKPPTKSPAGCDAKGRYAARANRILAHAKDKLTLDEREIDAGEFVRDGPDMGNSGVSVINTMHKTKTSIRYVCTWRWA
jgi:hypothetical protein